MKVSLALASREGVSPQTARGCLATNLSLPGFGSLIGGRIAGYPQAALTLGGFGLTLCFGLRFIVWYLANRASLNNPMDPIENMSVIWLHVRWALAGMGLFAVSWLWALATSMSVIRQARIRELSGPKPLPPKLDRPPILPPRL